MAGAWYLVNSMREAAKITARQELEAHARELSAGVAATFEGIAGQLKTLANAKTTTALFEQNDPMILDQQGEILGARFQASRKLRLVLPGAYQLDDSSAPPLSFACLDMLRRAENSSAIIGAEAHLFGTGKEHIVMVERVTNEAGNLIGLLHLSLASSILQQAVAVLQLDAAYVELQQRISGKPLVLAKQGDGSLRTGEPITTSINGTRWSLAYWDKGFAEQAEPGGSGLMTLVIAVLVVALVALAGMRWNRSRGKTRLDNQGDSVVYGGAIQAIMDGAHPGVENLIPNLPKGKRKKPAAQPISTGDEGEDITAMARPADRPKAAPGQPRDPTDPDRTPVKEQPAREQKPLATEISRGIFRAYDIRGIVGKELTPETVTSIGRAIGSEANDRGEQTVIVGRDGRDSSPELAEALIKGLCAAGRNVIDIGMVPTPVLYFATHHLDANSGVMLTGSHNGPEYNGLKIVLGGETLSEGAIQDIYERIIEQDLTSGMGEVQTRDLVADYIRRITEDIPVALGKAFKLVVDCGNGIPGAVAPELYRALGHDVVELYCDVDGKFPNHHPDPSQVKNMQDLIARVKQEQADLGFAFDGDGDRLGVVDTEGNIIWPDRQMMLLAKDVLSRNPGAVIIYDVKCSRYLRTTIEANGGKPLMWKTGHSLIKSKMKETGAQLAGEMSGHIFFKERWYGFDDALYTGARLLEVLMAAKIRPTEVFKELPEGVSTPEIRVDLTEQAHKTFMADMKEKMVFEGAEIFDIDGFRVEFSDGWGLVRPSNTSPCLVLRFEADSQAALERIQEQFRSLMLSINPDLQLSF
jgi:phosphomannomutase/phosphoglucomutase